MENNPGISLFQASEFDSFNINSQQPEELEAIEDDKRRNEELKEMLKNAFDDLEDEDKLTIDSNCTTVNMPDQGYDNVNDRHLHTQIHRCQGGCNQELNEIDNNPQNVARIKSSDYNTNSHLEVLYSVRLREIERLRDEINNLKKVHNEEITSVLQQLTFMETEKEKNERLQKESQKYLDEERIRSANFEKEISCLRQRLYENENQKRDIAGQLEIAMITNQDLEQRLKAIEKFDSSKSEEKQFDQVLNKLNTEHKQEIINMQKQIDDLSDKLVCKETECKRLGREFMELQRVHESTLIEKSDSLNKLAKKLEETQSNYHNLISSNDTQKLRISLENVCKENEQLNAKLQSLTAECEVLRYDLNQYESLSKLSEFLTKDGISPDNDSIFQIGYAKNEGLRKLKDELHRAMMNQKSKRNEIRELQNKLFQADEVIKQLNNQDDNYKSRIKILEDEIRKLNVELRNAKNEIVDKSNPEESVVNKINGLERDIILMKEDNEKLKKEFSEKEKKLQEGKKAAIDQYSKEYMKFHQEKLSQVRKDIADSFQCRISELESRLDESFKECSEIKELYTEACINKDKLMSLNDNIKKELDELQNTNASLNDSIQFLTTENERLKKLVDENAEQRLKSQVSQLNDELERTTCHANRLEQRLESLTKLTTTQTIENEKLQRKIVLLETEIMDWKKKFEQTIKPAAEDNKRIIEVANQLQEYRDKWQLLNEKYLHDVELVKLSAAECITKIKVENSEKIVQLRIEHAQNISQLEIEHRKLCEKIEKNLRAITMQAFEEEISKITINCRQIIQHLVQTIEQYKFNADEKDQIDKLECEKNSEGELREIHRKYNEIFEKYTKTVEMNTKVCAELNVLQEKYENSRKAALHYKQLSDKHYNLLRKEVEEHRNLIRSIQEQIDHAIDNKPAEVSVVLANVQKQLTVSMNR